MGRLFEMTALEQSMLAQIADFKACDGVTPEAAKLMEYAEKIIRGEMTMEQITREIQEETK